MNNALYQDHEHGISTIDTGFVRPKLAASHLIIENQHAAFIDVGTNHSVPNLLATLEAKNIAPEAVDYIIVTHVHLDHAGGAGLLMQHFPNARCVVHPLGARHLIDPTKLIAGSKAVYGEEAFQRLYGEIIPIPEDRVILAEDESTVSLQGRELLFLDTPGHARHHCCIYDARSRSFTTGDTFGIAYTELTTEQGPFIFITTTPVQFEPLALHQSIDRLMQYQPEKMYLTHYGEVGSVAKLADCLHESLDQMVLFTEAVISETEDDPDPDKRYHLLSERILSHFISRLQEHQCTLPEAQCRELLKMDAGLNAQGLLVWWERADKA